MYIKKNDSIFLDRLIFLFFYKGYGKEKKKFFEILGYENNVFEGWMVEQDGMNNYNKNVY